MCYGDANHGHDGYYQREMERDQERRDRERDEH